LVVNREPSVSDNLVVRNKI